MLAMYDPARHRTSAHTFGQDHFVACSSYLCLALWHLGPRDVAALQEATAELRALGATHALPVWAALATALDGKLLVERGELEPGARRLEQGIAALAEIRVVLLRPMLCAWLAEARAARGEVAAGAAALEQGWEAAKGGEHWMDAELHRARGALLVAARRAPADLDAAERSLREALAGARSQSSRTLELRTANGLARLWARQGRRGEAR